MFGLTDLKKIHFYTGIIDFRCGIDRMSQVVSECLELDPYSSEAFLFLSRDRKKIKILKFDATGFVLIIKRLDCEKWPFIKDRMEAKKIEISMDEFSWFLGGGDIFKIKRFKSAKYSCVL
jgi:transposase